MSLDPDDPRPPFQQVAHALRAAILTKQYAAGEKLPSGQELARRYGVARMTVQQALRILREEGLIVSRQGSGVFVRARTVRPVGLRPHVERAFESGRVAIDFAGFSGETLHGALQEPLDMVRSGRHVPESIRIRALLPDPTAPWAIPCRVEDLADDPEFRERSRGIMHRSIAPLLESVTELADLGLVANATAEIRVHHAAPLFKLYLINDTEAFFGFYPVEERTVSISRKQHKIYDLMGKDATLFQHTAEADPEAMGSQYVTQARTWFDSMWTSIGRDYQP